MRVKVVGQYVHHHHHWWCRREKKGKGRVVSEDYCGREIGCVIFEVMLLQAWEECLGRTRRASKGVKGQVLFMVPHLWSSERSFLFAPTFIICNLVLRRLFWFLLLPLPLEVFNGDHTNSSSSSMSLGLRVDNPVCRRVKWHDLISCGNIWFNECVVGAAVPPPRRSLSSLRFSFSLYLSACCWSGRLSGLLLRRFGCMFRLFFWQWSAIVRNCKESVSKERSGIVVVARLENSHLLFVCLDCCPFDSVGRIQESAHRRFRKFLRSSDRLGCLTEAPWSQGYLILLREDVPLDMSLITRRARIMGL